MAQHALLFLAGLIFGITLIEWLRPETTMGAAAIVVLSVLVVYVAGLALANRTAARSHNDARR
jgi:apolipoprotein N-acyltransferase